MKKRKRDPMDWASEVNGGVICRRGYLLRPKSSKPTKSERRNRGSESVIAQEVTQGLELELRDMLRKLPGLKAYERKNRGVEKPRGTWRDLMVVNRRFLRRVVKGYLVELATMAPGGSLN